MFCNYHELFKIMIIDPAPKEHLKNLRFQLELIVFEEPVLKFLLTDNQGDKFAVFMDCSKSELDNILVDGVLLEENLFLDMLLNLIGLEIYAEKPNQEENAFEILRDLLAYFAPDHDYVAYKTEIEDALLHHIGNAIRFKDVDCETPTQQTNITAQQILERIDFILRIHGQYLCLKDSDEYQKMVNQAVWKLLAYLSDTFMFIGSHENHMIDYLKSGQAVTRESITECITQDMDYFNHELITADLRRLNISPSVKLYDFTNVIILTEKHDIDHVQSAIGASQLYQFQLTVSLTYRNYLIHKGLASSEELGKLQNECITLFYNVMNNQKTKSFELLDGLYKIDVTRDQMTGHVHFAVTIADEILDCFETSTVLAC